VIREHPILNIAAADRLEHDFPGLDLIVIESGGDNLASTFSLDPVDCWLFVIDTTVGEDIPRERGPGVVQRDLLVINRTDLAPYVGVDLDLLARDGARVRDDKPVLFTNRKTGDGIDQVIRDIAHDVLLEP
jgi:urease accessory protein